MSSTKGMSLDEFICRRLKPVRVAVSLLVRELQIAPGNDVHFEKDYLNDVINTFELFVEEYDRVSSVTSRQTHTRMSAPSAAPAKAALKLA